MGRFHRHDAAHSDHYHDANGNTVWYTDEEIAQARAREKVSEKYGDHSGYETGGSRVQVLEDIFTENDKLAASNRAGFAENGVTCINLMSSPGSGKTELLTATLRKLADEIRIGIVEGDIETDLDAQRLRPFDVQVSVLNTAAGFGGECHLDAPMVARALQDLDLETLDLVLIENVGNLVCPAEFEVGETAKAMVYSVTEGEDKPKKYPVMFRSVSAVVVNKIDLLPYLDFDMELFAANLRDVNPHAEVIEVSAKTGEGIEQWLDWLRRQWTGRQPVAPTVSAERA